MKYIILYLLYIFSDSTHANIVIERDRNQTAPTPTGRSSKNPSSFFKLVSVSWMSGDGHTHANIVTERGRNPTTPTAILLPNVARILLHLRRHRYRTRAKSPTLLPTPLPTHPQRHCRHRRRRVRLPQHIRSWTPTPSTRQIPTVSRTEVCQLGSTVNPPTATVVLTPVADTDALRHMRATSQ